MNKIMQHDALSQALNHLLPNLIPAVCFTFYIGLGNNLDLSTAVMTLAYFNKLSWTQSWFPKFLTNYHELGVSFTRIQKFLSMPNVQEGLKGVLPVNSGIAISVEGNYSWGYSEKKIKNITSDFTNLRNLNF